MSNRLSSLWCLVLPWAWSLAAVAAPPLPATEALPVIGADQLEAKINEIEAATEVDEAVKARAVELYRKARSELEAIHSYEDAAERYARALSEAPDQAEALRRELDAAAPAPPTAEAMQVSTDTLEVLEQRLTKERADLAALEAKADQLSTKVRDEGRRPDAIKQRLRQARQELDGLAEPASEPESEPGPDPAAGPSEATGEPAGKKASLARAAPVAEAQRILNRILERSLGAEIHMLDQELLSQAPRLKLLQARYDRTSRSVGNVGARVKILEDLANRRRRLDADLARAQAVAAQQEARGKHPLLGAIAETNAKLGDEAAQLAAGLDRVTVEKQRLESATKQIEEDFDSAREQLEVAGLSQVLGRFLVEQRGLLSETLRSARAGDLRRREIAAAGLRHLQLTKQRRALGNLDAAMQERFAGLEADGVNEEDARRIRAGGRELLVKQRELLEKALAVNETYLRELKDLDFARARLLESAEGYRRFLDEHLLWTPNTRPLGPYTLTGLPQAVAWLSAPERWGAVATRLPAVLAEPGPILILLAALVLWVARKRLRRALHAAGSVVGDPRRDGIGVTFKALGLTLGLAAPWPLVLEALGWWLRTTDPQAALANAIGEGVGVAARMLFNLGALRLFCLSGGVAEVHFRWSAATLAPLRRNLPWLMRVIVPGGFFVGLFYAAPKEAGATGLTLFSYALVMVALGLFFKRILDPRGGCLASFYGRHPTGWLARLRYLWYLLGMLVPAVLVVLAGLGYLHTAAGLTHEVINSLWLILGIAVVRNLVMRWLTLARRKLAHRLAREREAARLGETEEVPAAEEVDLVAIDAQTRSLIHALMGVAAVVGLWWIWADLVPALGILDRVTLWWVDTGLEGETRTVPITLADLGMALILAVATVVAVRNLPGLLEILLLQRTAVTPGTRYAIITLSSYALTTLGVVLVFGAIGGSWSQIQWLVAAVSVGLGFGLQEIFGNFVSGLIILFERPIRVGDIVTVGDTTGTVTRIRIRATTITNWDRQELLVPNKEFITGRLLNWTLSNQTNRIVITVGAAYGSDVPAALNCMSEAATAHPEVLDDPAPMVTFEGFGESGLTLLLRCYLDAMDKRMSTISELHQDISRRLDEAGVVIAFPQRDIHLDTTRPLDIRLHRGGADGPSDTKR